MAIQSQDTQPLKKGRLLYIDNLRIVLTALVVLHHLAIQYGGSGNGNGHLSYLNSSCQAPPSPSTANNLSTIFLFNFSSGFFTKWICSNS